MNKSYFKINSSEVVSESFNDETVIINLDNGNYYSLNKIATDIWQLIENGLSYNDIFNQIASLYNGEDDYIKNSVKQFITELKQESLIAETKQPQKPLINKQGENKTKLNFEQPTIEKYDDMQELLLLDPIHEVDDDGWPNR